ncbi:hypothetical protein J2Z70_003883 [Paenibacillus silagei]|uniref:Uncharacterized protein n=1 Tax=Paenibacillus silagei TaxID=1670801 RepID=A0ABS4NUI1_9BACL|nr:hypothetical protein [Paenibacillus silagei]
MRPEEARSQKWLAERLLVFLNRRVVDPTDEILYNKKNPGLLAEAGMVYETGLEYLNDFFHAFYFFNQGAFDPGF